MSRDDRSPSARGGAPRRKRDDDVLKVYGAHAVGAVLRRRPEGIVRAYIDAQRKSDFGFLMKELASRRVAYRLLPAEELARVAGSHHHEGVCVLARPRPQPSLEGWIASCPPAACAVVLDGVENPHNLGAIVRTAAHFGVRGVWVVGRAATHGAAARVAEGGAEVVDVFDVGSAVPVLLALARAGFQVVGAAAGRGTSLFEHRLHRRTAFVLGAEHAGLSAEAARLVELEMHIPGTGAVESLNVSSAAAVFMSEHARQRSRRT
jgi:TrmH RNA methyltransferase